MKFKFRASWNEPRDVESSRGESFPLVAASSYDVPAVVSVDLDGKRVLINFHYDFDEKEEREVIIEARAKHAVRVFGGKKSGRLLTIEIVAKSIDEATASLDEVATDLRKLRERLEKQTPIHRVVHLSMLEQALPSMGHVIDEQLKALRSSSA